MKPKPLTGRVAYVTGGAGGIGRATAMRLLAEGACVMLADIDRGALDGAIGSLRQTFGKDNVAGAVADITNEAAVAASFADTLRQFGGLDIVVSNAGIASASPVEDTSLELWNRNISILATGYFLVAHPAPARSAPTTPAGSQCRARRAGRPRAQDASP